MKIYTRTGDEGTTSLIGGTRVLKSDHRIDTYGTVDELNSYIGLIQCQDIDPHVQQILKEIQDRLFTIGSALAADPQKSKMKLPDLRAADVSLLEGEMDAMNEVLPELKHFILPGGNTIVSYCHISRAICRRAERLTVRLALETEVDKIIIIYLNRLSDYLFVLGRKLCLDNRVEENIWLPRL